MAIADMFLKVQGVTGESGDAQHKGEIEVVAWSWGMRTWASDGGLRDFGGAGMTELEVVKRVDRSSPTLMSYLRTNKVIPQVRLTVRKAGKDPLEYFTIALQKVKITAVRVESQNTELVERVHLGFSRVDVSYVLQNPDGSPGAAVEFSADAHAGT